MTPKGTPKTPIPWDSPWMFCKVGVFLKFMGGFLWDLGHPWFCFHWGQGHPCIPGALPYGTVLPLAPFLLGLWAIPFGIGLSLGLFPLGLDLSLVPFPLGLGPFPLGLGPFPLGFTYPWCHFLWDWSHYLWDWGYSQDYSLWD